MSYNVKMPRSQRKPSKPSDDEARNGFVEDYLLYLLARASQQASAQFHAVVKSRGLSVPEWRVLGALWSRPTTIGALAEVTLYQQPTLTKVIDRMERDGLVARRTDAADGRRTLVDLTAAGRGTAAALVPMARDHERSVLRGYAPAEAAALKRALRILIARTGGTA